MTAPLTLTAYAKRRGCSVKSVSVAASSGRLVESVGRDERGRPVILDPELADREWTANTRRRADQPDPVRSPCLPDPPLLEEMPSAAATYPSAGPAPAAVPPFNVSRDLRAAAAARREAAQADLAELELAEKRGRLVDAGEARKDVFARVSIAKTRLLGVPSLVAQDAPDLAPRIVPMIERRIREALEGLSADG